MTLSEAPAELRRVSKDFKAVSRGDDVKIYYLPTGTPVYTLSSQGLHAADGSVITSFESARGYRDAVNAIANLGFRLDELSHATSVKKKDFRMILGRDVRVRAGDVEYVYAITAKGGRGLAISDSLIASGQEYPLNMRSIKSALKKMKTDKPAGKRDGVEPVVTSTPVETQPAPPVPREMGVSVSEPKRDETPPSVDEPEPDEDLIYDARYVGRERRMLGGFLIACDRISPPEIGIRYTTDDGVMLSAMDPAHVMMLIIRLPLRARVHDRFGVFEGRFDCESPDTFSILKNLEYDSILMQLYWKKLVFKFKKDMKTRGEIELKKSSSTVIIPKLVFTSKFMVDFKTLKHVVNRVDDFSDHIVFVGGMPDLGENKVFVPVRSESLKTVFAFPIERHELPEEFRHIYGVLYVKWALESIQLAGDSPEKLMIQLMKQGIIRIASPQDDAEALIAPKLEESGREADIALIKKIGTIPIYESPARRVQVLTEKTPDIAVELEPSVFTKYLRIIFSRPQLNQLGLVLSGEGVLYLLSADGGFAVTALNKVNIKGLGKDDFLALTATLSDKLYSTMANYFSRSSRKLHMSVFIPKSDRESGEAYISGTDAADQPHVFTLPMDLQPDLVSGRESLEGFFDRHRAVQIYSGAPQLDEILGILDEFHRGIVNVYVKNGGIVATGTPESYQRWDEVLEKKLPITKLKWDGMEVGGAYQARELIEFFRMAKKAGGSVEFLIEKKDKDPYLVLQGENIEDRARTVVILHPSYSLD